MNQEIKAKWLNALRSGEYKQTDDQLRDSQGYCCLGVLCDLHSKETNTNWIQDTYLTEEVSLPRAVKIWINFVSANKTTVVIKNVSRTLAEHNDDGRTFLEIADAIESQL